jgi:hypothetical protein
MAEFVEATGKCSKKEQKQTDSEGKADSNTTKEAIRSSAAHSCEQTTFTYWKIESTTYL